MRDLGLSSREATPGMLECMGAGTVEGPPHHTGSPHGGLPGGATAGIYSAQTAAGCSPPGISSLLNTMDSHHHHQRTSAFMFSSPPLVALHNMAESKVPVTSSAPGSTTAAILSQPNPYTTSGLGLSSSFKAPGLSHGIHDILMPRHLPGGHFGQLSMPRINMNGATNMYFNSTAASRFPKPIADLPNRPPVYWPGMMQGSPWRTAGR